MKRSAAIRRLAALGVALFVSTFVAAAALALDLYAVTMPDSVVGFRAGAVKSYDDPSLGRSVRYELGDIWADVYVYDYGIARIPDGPRSPAARSAMNAAIKEIYAVDFYGAIKPKGGVFQAGGGRAAFQCRAFELGRTQPGPPILNSLLCVTGACNKLVKIRISAPLSDGAFAGRARAFVAAWSAHLSASHPTLQRRV